MLSQQFCTTIFFIFATLSVSGYECDQLVPRLKSALTCLDNNSHHEYANHAYYFVQEKSHRLLMVVSPIKSPEQAVIGLHVHTKNDLIKNLGVRASLYYLDPAFVPIKTYLKEEIQRTKHPILLKVIQHIILFDQKLHLGFVQLHPGNIMINVHLGQIIFLYAAPTLPASEAIPMSKDVYMIAELEKFDSWLEQIICDTEALFAKSALQKSKEVVLDNRFRQALSGMKDSGSDYAALCLTLREIIKDLHGIEVSQRSIVLTIDPVHHQKPANDDWMPHVYIILLIFVTGLLASLVLTYYCFKSKNSLRNNDDFASRVIQTNRTLINSDTSQYQRGNQP